MNWLTNPNLWAGLLTLTALEIVLGIDNIVFISILSGKLPPEQQDRGRKMGLLLALIPRILLLMLIGLVLKMTKPLLTIGSFQPTLQDLVLIVGGLFLIAKSVKEIHHKLEAEEEHISQAQASFSSVLIQIMLLNIVFSLDSVITAIGMVRDVGVMITAVLLSTLFMMGFAGPVGRFVEKHPTVKILALSFLILIGGNLLAEGFGVHIPKGYTYFAMGFAIFVEMINLKTVRHAQRPVHLRNTPSIEEMEENNGS